MIQHDKHVPIISPKKLILPLLKWFRKSKLTLLMKHQYLFGVLNGAFMVVADFMKQYKTMRGVSLSKSYEGLHLRTM
jgi:hypoxanthine phosphoribosyltransferase